MPHASCHTPSIVSFLFRKCKGTTFILPTRHRALKNNLFNSPLTPLPNNFQFLYPQLFGILK